jgi:NAD(P)-dependent dehydrogenase (short-subunit alcohol dehydrogenase family)
MNKLSGKVALITDGDSGIGRAVEVAFTKEGAETTLILLASNPFITGNVSHSNGGEIN